jgi:hypothetical protein
VPAGVRFRNCRSTSAFYINDGTIDAVVGLNRAKHAMIVNGDRSTE